MAVAPSTRQHLDDHLGQAEFALNVAANFDCLKGTPAHYSVRTALARVAEARRWMRGELAVSGAGMRPAEPAYRTVGERRRIVHRRLAGLAP